MFRKIAVALLLVIGTATLASGTDTVTFPSTYSEGILLTAKLRKPEGDGPFPAVVMLHSCLGPSKYQDPWEDRLINWGYVTLRVDSFGPRGESNDCANTGKIDFLTRAADSHDAKSYLSRLPFVDSKRIAVIGWSEGGITTLSALHKTFGGKGKTRFRVGIAFYPYCNDSLENMNSPLLILIGEKDDWCPARSCTRLMPKEKNPEREIILKVYPGAYHCFDWEGLDMIYQGHRLLHDPAAEADAIIQVRNFLEKHMK
jgi:dienelactone hydrolase